MGLEDMLTMGTQRWGPQPLGHASLAVSFPGARHVISLAGEPVAVVTETCQIRLKDGQENPGISVGGSVWMPIQ